ncbi:hypothetical protein DBR32_00240 [Taibaiella sp. KBW10]|uniref:T9SS type A sorting domain-containing protein n=1 Tax=Taibaiella sp. KBW10 TaxID=2153357 RepID=UPI000F5AEC6B|nr:T9SS type A sorting domain-containing protein [Taibaiella sp. KBW10]RQO32080.1 hypothetical protein DBR32_00240 [Taibaiella sp. KBW10]
MKKFTLSISVLLLWMLLPKYTAAQTSACTFVSPAVELNYTNSNIAGDCIVNVNLSFIININNGNKYTVLHLWPESTYPNPSFPYALNNEPKSSQNGGNGALNNALATIIINRNTNPATLLSTYAPDPTIDDNTLPAINQVKDASDGLILKVTDMGNGNIYYQIENVSLVYPGACNQIIKFKGDAWSSNAASLNVQCSMVGFTYLSNIPTLNGIQLCQKSGQQSQYRFSISAQQPNYLVDYSVDIFADVDSSKDFNPFIDTVRVASYPSSSLPDITSTTPYSSGFIPFSWSATHNNNDLFYILGNIKVTDLISSTTTTYSNTILTTTVADCSSPLPLNNLVLTGKREGNWVRLFWHVPNDDTKYAIEKQIPEQSTWKQAGIEKMKTGGEGLAFDDYAYTDMEPATCLYRLRAINPDGSFDYSNTLRMNGNNPSLNLYVFPNPASQNEIRIMADVPLNEVANISVINGLGQEVRQLKNISSGTIYFNDLSSGVYYICIYNNHEKIAKTLAVK